MRLELLVGPILMFLAAGGYQASQDLKIYNIGLQVSGPSLVTKGNPIYTE